MNNSNIYVYDSKEINITFKINKMEGSGCPINIKINLYNLCSQLIDCYLKKLDFSYRNTI